MSKVIITGAGGFIGTELTKRLIANGTEVIAISMIFNDNYPQNKLITRIESEISAYEQLKDLIPNDEYDAFYHLAWIGVNGAEKADPTVQSNNIKMTMDCAKVAKDKGCKLFLCAGTIAERSVESLEYLDKTNGGMLYGVAKHCTHIMLESYCKNIGLDYVWMQFSNIYGPNNKTGNLVSYTLNELSNGREATFGPALQPYDFIFVDDLIEAVYRLGMKKPKDNFYFIGSGEPRILKNYLEEIGKQYGKPELIKIGIRADDGIVYKMDMFDTKRLVDEIGEYTSRTFSEGILYTIQKF